MMRKTFIALAAGLALTVAAGPTLAQTSDQKAAVDSAKGQGIVGEQGDGFLAFVSGSGPASLVSSLNAINAARAQLYRDIAVKSGVSEAAAGQAAALQVFSRLPPGAYYRPVDGAWTRK